MPTLVEIAFKTEIHSFKTHEAYVSACASNSALQKESQHLGTIVDANHGDRISKIGIKPSPQSLITYELRLDGHAAHKMQSGDHAYLIQQSTLPKSILITRPNSPEKNIINDVNKELALPLQKSARISDDGSDRKLTRSEYKQLRSMINDLARMGVILSPRESKKQKWMKRLTCYAW